MTGSADDLIATVRLFEQAIDPALVAYQSACIQAERSFLETQRREAPVGSVVVRSAAEWFAAYSRRRPLLYGMELYWTVTRLMGLAYLHDGITPRELTLIPDAPPSAFDPSPPRMKGPQGAPRLLVDVTATAGSPDRSGIQRYVRAFAREAVETGLGLPVIIRDGVAYDAYRSNLDGDPLRIEHGDTLLMLDANWAHPGSLLALIDRVKSDGGQVIVFIHDLVPLLFPDTCEESTALHFRRWLDAILPLADAFISSTRTGADDLKRLLAMIPGLDAARPIGWVNAGSGLRASGQPPSATLVRAFRASKRVFLSVGTIEPRKGLPISVEAFEMLWRAGIDATYVIIGKSGWGLRHLEAKIRSHREHGRRLFWFDDAPDDDLVYSYRNATALVMPSIAEGFGMPLVEAAQFGLPVIVSDIPVFREVTSQQPVTYFKVCDGTSLFDSLKACLRGGSYEQRKPAPYMSWSENVRQMSDMVRTGSYQYARR